MGRTSLIMVMGFSTFLLMIGIDLSKVSTAAYENYVNYYNEIAAHNIAISVANIYCNDLYRNPNSRPNVTGIAFAGGVANVKTDTLSGGRVRLRVTSEYQGVKDTVIIVWGQSKFSKFAYYSAIEGAIYWITGDTVWGPFHTQQRLNVSGNPVFYGKVTTKNGLFKSPSSSKPKFFGGYQSPVSLTLPMDMNPLKIAAQTGGRYISGKDVEITFNADGTLTVKEGSSSPQTMALSTYTPNGTIYVDHGNLRIKGTVSGKVTVAATGSSGAAKGNVRIDDDIVYKNDPRLGPSSDMLGICAQNDVIITDNAANNNNVRIDASVFSLSGGFKAENYNTRPVSGTIHLLGGIIQHQRGPVGTFSGSPPTISTGFLKNYRYDSRFMVESPPFFPTTGSYEILSWYEK